MFHQDVMKEMLMVEDIESSRNTNEDQIVLIFGWNLRNEWYRTKGHQ